MKRRLMLILLAFSLFLGCMPAGLAYAEGSGTETAEEEVAPTEDMLLLNALGIFNDSMLEKAGESVKRGEYARIAVKFANVELVRTDAAYSDLEGEAANYAATAVENGLMDDGIMGKFNADQAITGMEVAMTVVTSFGFLEAAKKWGGYDKAAARNGLCDGKETLPELTYVQLANVLVKALSKKPMPNAWEKKQDKIYLEERLGHQVFSGKVLATDLAGLNGKSATRDGEVNVDGVLYETELDMSEYIGSTIKFLVELGGVTGDSDKLVYVYPNAQSNAVTIQAKDLLDFDGTRYRYQDGNKVKKVNVSANKTVIYNGVQRYTYTNADLKPERGWVKVIDGDGNGESSVIFVYEYTVMIVSAVDGDKMKINDKNSASLVLDYSDADSVIVKRGERTVTVDDIRSDEVISIFKSEDSKKIKIYISNEKATGVITSVQTDDKYQISIGGELFIVNQDYFNSFTSDSGKVLMGKSVEGYIDSFGELVYISYTDSGSELGYLVKAKLTENDEGKEEVRFTVYTGEKNFLTIRTGGERLYVDGRRYKISQVLKMLNKDKGVNNDSDQIKPQLIQFTRDSEGYITSIDTAYNNQDAINSLSSAADEAAARTEFARRKPTDDESKDSMRLIYSSYIAPSSEESSDGMIATRSGSNGLSFGRGMSPIRAKTGVKVFVVPLATSEHALDPSYYQMKDAYYFVSQNYKVEGYSFTDSFVADVIVSYSETVSSGKNFTNFKAFVVTGLQEIYDEELEEIVVRIDFAGTYGGRTFFYAKEDAHWKNVQPYGDSNYYLPRKLGVGDIFVADVDSTGTITNIALMYDAEIDDDVLEQQRRHYDPTQLANYPEFDDYVDRINADNPIEQFTGSSRFYSKMYSNMAPMHRKKSDNIEDHWWFLDVYEFDRDTLMAKTTFEDLRTYTGDKEAIEFNIENLDYGVSSIYYIDKTDYKITVTGGDSTGKGISYDMIRDYKTYGNDYTRIIIGKEDGAYQRMMFVIRDYKG